MKTKIFYLWVFILLLTKTVLLAGIGDDIGIYPTMLLSRKTPLINGTTAAFDILLTSVNATGTTTGRWVMYKTSATLEQLNSDGGAATNYFNVLLSTSDSIFDIINRGNEITNWTFTISADCYGLQLATGSVAVRVDGEGTTDGLQYDIGGKATSVSTGVVNTVYLNGTLYSSKYFEPVPYKRYEIYDINQNLAIGTTMYLYEGVKSTDTTIPIAIPQTDLRRFEYSGNAPLIGTANMALEFQVKRGTWTNTTNDKSQIFLNVR